MNRLALHWQILIGMIVGATIGISLNFSVGERVTSVPDKELPAGLTSLEISDSPSLIRITFTRDNEMAKEIVVDGTRKTKGALTTVEQLAEKEPEAAKWFQTFGRSRARYIGDGAKRLGGLFLRLLQMVAVPLIVTSLVTGVTGLGDASRLGKMFSRTLLYYLSTSLIAIVIGVTMVNVFRPGITDREDVPIIEAGQTSDQTLGELLFEQLETMIPSNPIAALADASFLSIISFSLAFSIFAVIVGGRTLEIIREFFDAAFDVMMAMTMAIIRLAPLGVTFMMLYVTATQGPAVFRSLAMYMITVLVSLACHALIVLPAILHFVAKKNPLEIRAGNVSRAADGV